MIRYRLNKNTGHLIPSFPNVVTLLQIFGVGLLFCGGIIRWLLFEFNSDWNSCLAFYESCFAGSVCFKAIKNWGNIFILSAKIDRTTDTQRAVGFSNC